MGKTEIARRLARLSNSPFLKVEASKFTEVGYVGRDVESMIRDLTEAAVDIVRREKRAEVQDKARRNVEEQILDLLLPPSPSMAFEGPPEGEEARPPPSPSGPPGRSCASSYARGSSTAASWRWRCASARSRPSRS